MDTPYQLMARFILETNDPSRRIIRLIDYPSWYKYKMNYPDELCKSPIETRNLYWFLHYCILSNYVKNSAEYKYKQTIVRLVQHLYTQTDHPSRRTTQASSPEKTNYADSSS